MMEVEASSPLTAMQPHEFQHHSSWGFGSNMGRPTASRGLEGSLFGPKLEIGGSRTSFFDLDMRMESSPTSTLVADLSQNFHIDKTPQVPTPRRSLFTSLNVQRPFVTTPPIPTSSPGHDSMDISPLPHKPPFSMLRSPVSSESPDISMCSSPPAPSPIQNKMEPPRRPLLAERKRTSSLTRPSLLRNNRFTTSNSVSFKAQSSNPLSMGRPAPPQINLEELFGTASPERSMSADPQSSKFLVPPPPRPFGGIGAGLDGSPLAAPNRCRPAFQRPKGKVRRTLSMFEHPEDVMQREKDGMSTTSPSPKASPGENSYLPCFGIKDDPLRRIDRSVLCDIMDRNYQEHYDEFTIVDCRFEYEYNGGHIAGAVNVNSTDALEELFFEKEKLAAEGIKIDMEDDEQPEKRRLIIFHCEYSAHRAPRMALHLRKRDRHFNQHRYPSLTYPDIYILQGGYSSFFNEHKLRCEPQEYVEMGDEKHKRTCEREMHRFRRNTKFGRTQSFTYGAQLHDNIDSSPSAAVARRPAAAACSKEDGDSHPFPARNRRMASY